MSDTLRDQLLGLGFKPVPKPERKPDPRGASARPHPGKGGKPASGRPSGGRNA
ncbi:DUF2058 domain-containing protein, partial [Xanthomonas sp. Kuri4-1]